MRNKNIFIILILMISSASHGGWWGKIKEFIPFQKNSKTIKTETIEEPISDVISDEEEENSRNFPLETGILNEKQDYIPEQDDEELLLRSPSTDAGIILQNNNKKFFIPFATSTHEAHSKLKNILEKDPGGVWTISFRGFRALYYHSVTEESTQRLWAFLAEDTRDMTGNDVRFHVNDKLFQIPQSHAKNLFEQVLQHEYEQPLQYPSGEYKPYGASGIRSRKLLTIQYKDDEIRLKDPTTEKVAEALEILTSSSEKNPGFEMTVYTEDGKQHTVTNFLGIRRFIIGENSEITKCRIVTPSSKLVIAHPEKEQLREISDFLKNTKNEFKPYVFRITMLNGDYYTVKFPVEIDSLKEIIPDEQNVSLIIYSDKEKKEGPMRHMEMKMEFPEIPLTKVWEILNLIKENNQKEKFSSGIFIKDQNFSLNGPGSFLAKESFIQLLKELEALTRKINKKAETISIIFSNKTSDESFGLEGKIPVKNFPETCQKIHEILQELKKEGGNTPSPKKGWFNFWSHSPKIPGDFRIINESGSSNPWGNFEETISYIKKNILTIKGEKK